MEQIRESFSQIEDTRHAGYVEHDLVDVLILVMGCVISGITELADMMVYFASKIDFYREHFGIEKYPSKPTLSRILNMIDGDAVGQIIVQIMRKNAENIGDIIAVDGKAIISPIFPALVQWLDTFYGGKSGNPKRKNYPMLFDADHKPKSAYYAVRNF